MYAVVIFPFTQSIQVISILVKKNIEKNKSKVCYSNKNLEILFLTKVLFITDLQNEEEGLYKIYLKEVFGKFFLLFINRNILMSFSESFFRYVIIYYFTI
jgi:hypothetical protein